MPQIHGWLSNAENKIEKSGHWQCDLSDDSFLVYVHSFIDALTACF